MRLWRRREASRILAFENHGGGPLTFILEPWGHQVPISQAQTVRVEILGGGGELVTEHFVDALALYVPSGTTIRLDEGKGFGEPWPAFPSTGTLSTQQFVRGFFNRPGGP